ncbi:larval cuticle protein 2-like [Teleopsis dalmanni]|uniref:larval cuticle protein 2-like n=1 Tax=Teleopsis dalmanni TaxID=139649 RepID=UPI0018CDFE4E|nr:larval cuticle protein 2-like [Teleopsis dalmanni]
MFKYLLLLAIVGFTYGANSYRSNALSTFGKSSYGGSSQYKRPVSHASSSDDAHAEVRTLSSDVRQDGFDYALETSNSIVAKAAGDDHGNVHGEFGWVDPNGEHVQISYVADENGYQPTGAWIPTPPPIPEAILKALEYIRTHPPKEEVHSQSHAYGKKHFG